MRPRPAVRSAASIAALSVIAASPAAAQDFMFGTPAAWLRIQAGMNFASADSDLFDDWMSRLTLDESDFHAPALGGEVGLRLSDRADLLIGARYSRSSAESEYRELIDQDDLPIVQETRLTIAPVTAGLRFNVLPSGRTISEFAWIPAPFVPYVGAAAGVTWYRFEQEGDFVDELSDELPIYSVSLRSSGWAPTAHLFAGADFNLNRRFALGLEARYAAANADLNPLSYDGYEPIDLSGFWTSIGLTVRF